MRPGAMRPGAHEAGAHEAGAHEAEAHEAGTQRHAPRLTTQTGAGVSGALVGWAQQTGEIRAGLVFIEYIWLHDSERSRGHMVHSPVRVPAQQQTTS